MADMNDGLRDLRNLIAAGDYRPVVMLAAVANTLRRIVEGTANYPDLAAEGCLAIIQSTQKLLAEKNSILSGHSVRSGQVGDELRAKLNTLVSRAQAGADAFDDRIKIIDRASRAFDAERKKGRLMVCNRETFVSQKLRESKRMKLRARELALLPRDDWK